MADSGSQRDTVFDVDVQRLAQIYAQAALDAAGDRTAQQALVNEFGLLEGVLAKQPRAEELFSSRLIGPDEKMAIVDRVFGKALSPGMLNTLRVMIKHGRLGYLRPVARAVHELWERRSNRIRVDVRTAYPIDAKLETEIRQTLVELLQCEPTLVKSVHPELLGGFVIRAGDRVYDASIRTELERTRAGMVTRAIAAIETRPEQFIERSSS